TPETLSLLAVSVVRVFGTRSGLNKRVSGAGEPHRRRHAMKLPPLAAQLEKAIADFISEKFDTIPAESTIREHISPALEKWREDKVKAGN
ncbi:MAG: hypothetical protein WCC90_09545, partial [Methylocella sp.]